ncbi:hypothetical protein ACIQ6Y_20570 [Streptomyces sp. NPDC096205]|uniref:hypothetical protein n=1 Tax=Streptomyces sp. NPDC096205 TaxID=3366081 RepID=UPI0038182BB4
MPSTTVRRARRSTAAAVAVAVALVVLAGCGTGDGEAEESGKSEGRPAASGSASSDSGRSPGAEAAGLISKALEVTFDQDYLVSTRRKETEGTTVLRSAMTGGGAVCEAHSGKGSASLDFVVTASALYSRGSEEALRLSPEARADPVRVEVMADRWVKRNVGAYSIMREMCESKAQRTWLEDRIPSLDELAEATPAQRPGVVRGQPTTTITYRREGGPLEFHIAAEGIPFLLRVTHPAKDLDESFSGFGVPFRVATPPGAVSELQMAQEVLAAQ